MIVVRLKPSPLVKRRTPAVRSRHRHARLAEHFHGAGEYLFDTRSLVFLRRGSPVHPSFALPQPWTVVGLNRQGETRALGVVVEADSHSLVVLSPVPSVRGIDRIVLGDFSFMPSAKDAV